MASAAPQGPDASSPSSSPFKSSDMGRAKIFDLVTETFLEKIEEVYNFENFAACYKDVYKAEPAFAESLYIEFISHLKDSFLEEVNNLKKEGNLEELFGKLDTLEEEAKDREMPAWRPSGMPEEDVCSPVAPYLLKRKKELKQKLKEKEEENAELAQAVLAGRKEIVEMQAEIQRRKEAWEATARDARDFVNTLEELP